MSKLWRDSYNVTTKSLKNINRTVGNELTGCRGKKRFDLEHAQAMASLNDQDSYKCDFCGQHHLTSKRKK